MNFGDKSWIQSKTFWTAVIAFAIGGAKAIGYETPPYILEMLVAFGLYSLRDAIGKK